MRLLRLGTALAAVLALAPPAVAAVSPAVSLHASPETTVSGDPVTLSGQATGAPAGTSVTLYASAYPYKAENAVASAVTAADGSFSFTATPDRNTDYRAVLAGSSAPRPRRSSTSGSRASR
jgi:hypothetical protein